MKLERSEMKKGIAFVFAALLLFGAVSIPSAVADPLNSNLLTPKLTCSDGNSDVSLHFRVRNMGPGTVAAGTTILYSYRTSASGPMKKGSYKIDAPIPVGESRTFPISPLAHWNPPIQQCTATVFTLTLPK
jgi:hypothetical protein